MTNFQCQRRIAAITVCDSERDCPCLPRNKTAIIIILIDNFQIASILDNRYVELERMSFHWQRMTMRITGAIASVAVIVPV